jgi:hypothetical protein
MVSMQKPGTTGIQAYVWLCLSVGFMIWTAVCVQQFEVNFPQRSIVDLSQTLYGAGGLIMDAIWTGKAAIW